MLYDQSEKLKLHFPLKSGSLLSSIAFTPSWAS